MGKWEMVRLGDVCDVLNGFAFQSKNYCADGHRVIRITNVQKGVIVDDDPKYYEETPSLSKYELYCSDLLVSLTGNVGRVGLISENLLPAYLNQRVACLRIKRSSILKEYLFATLNSDIFERAAIDSAKGLAQKNMSTEWLKEHIIPLPPLPVQQQIADALDRASALIQKRKAQLENLDLLVKSQFVEMFGDPVTNQKGWEQQKLETVYSIIDGDRGANYPKQDDFSDDGDCLFLNAGNVTALGFRFDECQFITAEKDKTLRKGKLNRNDIVVTTRGTVGNIAYYDDRVPYENMRINSGMVILRPNTEINPYFFIAYFRNPVVYQRLISGTAQPQMPIGSMKNATIFLPPISLQNEFAAFVHQVEAQKSLLQTSLHRLEQSYKSLMQKCFRGEIF